MGNEAAIHRYKTRRYLSVLQISGPGKHGFTVHQLSVRLDMYTCCHPVNGAGLKGDGKQCDRVRSHRLMGESAESRSKAQATRDLKFPN